MNDRILRMMSTLAEASVCNTHPLSEADEGEGGDTAPESKKGMKMVFGVWRPVGRKLSKEEHAGLAKQYGDTAKQRWKEALDHSTKAQGAMEAGEDPSTHTTAMEKAHADYQLAKAAYHTHAAASKGQPHTDFYAHPVHAGKSEAQAKKNGEWPPPKSKPTPTSSGVSVKFGPSSTQNMIPWKGGHVSPGLANVEAKAAIHLSKKHLAGIAADASDEDILKAIPAEHRKGPPEYQAMLVNHARAHLKTLKAPHSPTAPEPPAPLDPWGPTDDE